MTARFCPWLCFLTFKSRVVGKRGGFERWGRRRGVVLLLDPSPASLIDPSDPHRRGRRAEARGAMASVKGAAVCVGVLAAAGRAMASAGAAAEGEAWNWPHHGTPPLSRAIRSVGPVVARACGFAILRAGHGRVWVCAPDGSADDDEDPPRSGMDSCTDSRDRG